MPKDKGEQGVLLCAHCQKLHKEDKIRGVTGIKAERLGEASAILESRDHRTRATPFASGWMLYKILDERGVAAEELWLCPNHVRTVPT